MQRGETKYVKNGIVLLEGPSTGAGTLVQAKGVLACRQRQHAVNVWAMRCGLPSSSSR